MLYALQSSWLPYEHPRGGALKKVRIAVTGSHVTCGTLAWSHWAAMAAVGWCVGQVGGRGRGGGRVWKTIALIKRNDENQCLDST